MNSLQLELDNINQKLELLIYRKKQLDSIMSEYSDVINRVKSLVLSMEDANIEPSNLLMEIEGIVFNVEKPQQPETTSEPTPGEQPTESEPKNETDLSFSREVVESFGFINKNKEEFEINECGEDWIIQLAPVTDEMTVNAIIDNFYPKHTDGEPEVEPKTSNPEFVKLMALVPVTTVPTPIQTQLNDQAYRRNDTLLIGFTNKKLMNSWTKWINKTWGDRVHISSDETLEEFPHCLSVLWYGTTIDWERLKVLDYSLKPDEQRTIKTPDFEFKKATETTTQIFRDGVLLGLAKNCDGHWESPQFKGERFDSIEEIASRMWELINSF